MKPSFYSCGPGGVVNCKYFDEVNGCLRDEEDTRQCPEFDSMKEAREEQNNWDD